MANTTENTSQGFVVRLGNSDTAELISARTVEKLVEVTGMNKDELIHFALKQMALHFLPAYEQDDGELREAQLKAIRGASPATSTPDECFTDRIF